MKARSLPCLLAGLLVGGLLHAEVALLGGSELAAALRNHPPCCVIDGRNALNRAKTPLPEALPYRPELRIKPTATIVVLADTDGEALRIAGIFEKQYPGKPILAVKGGLQGWHGATAAPAGKALGDGAPGATLQFVIPHNTCETGEPLQKLQSKKK
ncbi:MAG: hypothetical protein CVU33_12815 [Betaproteobacteria bacterium HGW-Betaproteobacteria-6]|jgi:hypothetical protein|nr:MAG: hypothetical protein CVU33_12815 [Betaproteobacteria bacterium HGW-Betaproteobacteria-6]